MHNRRGCQISHRRFQGFVSHPVLDGSYVEAPPQHAGAIRRPKRFQTELGGIEAGALGDQLAAV
jgi:hypothetical protein